MLINALTKSLVTNMIKNITKDLFTMAQIARILTIVKHLKVLTIMDMTLANVMRLMLQITSKHLFLVSHVRTGGSAILTQLLLRNKHPTIPNLNALMATNASTGIWSTVRLLTLRHRLLHAKTTNLAILTMSNQEITRNKPSKIPNLVWIKKFATKIKIAILTK